MPFERPTNVRPQQIFQKMEFSMSWIVEHFYNAFHMETFATSTQNV